jgi:phosphatidylglycerol lysyltransferase
MTTAPARAAEHSFFAKLRWFLPTFVALVLFGVSLGVLWRELRTAHWHEIARDVLATPRLSFGLALLLTILNYAVLAGYDLLAFEYVGRRLPLWRVLMASFLGYAIANNVGFALLSGASVRYRFYTRWGVTAQELSRVILFYSTTFWLGLLAVGGFSLGVSHLPAAHGLPAPGALHTLGWFLLVVSLSYLVVPSFRRTPIRLRSVEIALPVLWIRIAQLAVSCVDWLLAATVLYVLLPHGRLHFFGFTAAFVASQLLGVASHVPGGVGVFEGLLVLLLRPYWSSSQLLPALVVYRVVYYLLPLAVALVALLADEIRERRQAVGRFGAVLGRLTEQLTPRVLGIFTFLAGVGLLFSGATPAAPGRLYWLAGLLPLGVIEVSHFVGSVIGAGLLIVSSGLTRRLDGAYWLALGGIVIGAVASLLKGADVEEAGLLALLLFALVRARPAFDRRATLLQAWLSPGWLAAVLGAVGSSLWLCLFAFKHVAFSRDLWWQFEVHAQASRSLRASVGACVALFAVALSRLMKTAPHEAPAPDEADLVAAGAAIEAQTSTFPYTVFLRDKALLFDAERRGFIMYGVQGRTFVALGDPVSPPEQAPMLIRSFLERADDFSGVPVFYEVGKDELHWYADFGLTFMKLGEEARVDLGSFTLEGGRASKFRKALRHLEKEGARIRVVPAAEVAGLLGELRRVSDDWLSDKPGGEKGFSLGFFEPSYLARFPLAVVEHHGRIVAFANLWPGPQKVELSVDLMRYDRDAPSGLMEALFVWLMRWGKEQGYGVFVLGMAPLSGFESSPVAPLWARLGGFLYRHGEKLYNFQGLRAYKEKFDPVWEPRYLVYPGGLSLPRVLSDVSALIAGGYRRLILK